jgi:hypothetical protein
MKFGFVFFYMPKFIKISRGKRKSNCHNFFPRSSYLTKIWYRRNTKRRFNYNQKRVLANNYRNMRLIIWVSMQCGLRPWCCNSFMIASIFFIIIILKGIQPFVTLRFHAFLSIFQWFLSVGLCFVTCYLMLLFAIHTYTHTYICICVSSKVSANSKTLDSFNFSFKFP